MLTGLFNLAIIGWYTIKWYSPFGLKDWRYLPGNMICSDKQMFCVEQNIRTYFLSKIEITTIIYFPLNVFTATSARRGRRGSRSITKCLVGWVGWHQFWTLVQYVNSFHPRETHILRTLSSRRHTISQVIPHHNKVHMLLVNSVLIAGCSTARVSTLSNL